MSPTSRRPHLRHPTGPLSLNTSSPKEGGELGDLSSFLCLVQGCDGGGTCKQRGSVWVLICIWARCQPSSEVLTEGGGGTEGVTRPPPKQGGNKSPRPLLHFFKGPPVLCYLRPHFRLPGSPSSGLTSVTPAVGGSPFLHLALLQPRGLMSHTPFPLLRCHMTGWWWGRVGEA